MEDFQPRLISNRQFVGYEEEDIQRLNREEAEKFEKNPSMQSILAKIESDLGSGGRWEEHWLTVDAKGSRIYARIYYTENEAIAVAADGHIIRRLNYSSTNDGLKH